VTRSLSLETGSSVWKCIFVVTDALQCFPFLSRSFPPNSQVKEFLGADR